MPNGFARLVFPRGTVSRIFGSNRILKSQILLLALAGAAPAADNLAPDQAWKVLLEGNARFANSAPAHPRQGADQRRALANTQHPFAAVLACTDSRVPTEIIFDQGLGDLFVARTAGHVLDEAVLGSLEFAVERLGIRLVVVLGHQRCGAVAAALPGKPAAGHIASLVEAIRPAVEKAQGEGGDLLDHAVDANVALVVSKLKAALSGRADIRIQGARYDLDSGAVRPLQ